MLTIQKILLRNMPRFFELSATIAKFGFCATFIVNLLFITVTIAYTKVITGTYRKMLVIFAATCILFATIEVVVQPCIHNFNGGLVYFSLNDSPRFSQEVLRMGLVVYSSCYVAQLVFIAIQFLFRYLTLVQHPLRKSFQDWNQVYWILYFFCTGVLYGFLVFMSLKTDDYSDEYMREEMRVVYLKEIKDTPRILAVAYEKNGNVRWGIVMFLVVGSTMLGLQYAIITFCTIQMQKSMKTELAKLSERNRKLELQFFRALAIQIILPTVLLTVPIGSVLLLPLLDLKIRIQTGVIYALYSMYPPLDSIATMTIINEYRFGFVAMIKDMRGIVTREKPSSTSGAGISMVEMNTNSTRVGRYRADVTTN